MLGVLMGLIILGFLVSCVLISSSERDPDDRDDWKNKKF